MSIPLKTDYKVLHAKMSNIELGKHYKVGLSTIVKWNKNFDLHRGLFAAIDCDKFCNFYLNHTCEECTAEYNVYDSTIRTWARKLNLPRKSNKWKDIKVDVNKN